MATEIWILRHAEAAPAGIGGDGMRPLTAEGERQAGELGSALAARGFRAARVLSSPLVRARRTAEIVAAAGLAPGREVEIDPRLAPGGDSLDLAGEALTAGPGPPLLVGHNPDLEGLVHALTGETVRLKKGAFVRVERRGGRGRVLEQA